MKKYYYFMTGKKVWFELAVELFRDNIAEPVLWLGDPRHELKAQKTFSMCDVISFSNTTFGFFQNTAYSGELADFYQSKRYEKVKDVSLKMMDRIDKEGLFRRIDREMLFNKICVWALKIISANRPDFLLMAESPHNHVQYIIYEICKYSNVKVFSFGSWNIAPVLYLRENINGKRFVFNKRDNISTCDDIIIRQLLSWADSNEFKSGFVKETDYMKKQVQDDKNKNSNVGHFKDLIKNILLTNNILMKIFKRLHRLTPQQGIEDHKFALQRFIFANSKPLNISVRKIAGIKKNRHHMLMSCYNQIATKEVGCNPFVYYPLHYEPERTTCPDGGVYHDQFKVLALIRSLVPPDIAIFVKEHPTQLRTQYNGYIGRSPESYDLINSMHNVRVLSTDASTSYLIMNAIFVATLTGTAAIEAALLERKALIFGEAWFKDCPNIYTFTKGLSYEKLTSEAVVSREQVIEWLIDKYLKEGVPGFQNPSGSKIFNSFEGNPLFRSTEKNAIVSLAKTAIKQT